MTATLNRATFTSKIDFTQTQRDELVRLLNQQLADTSDLHSQAKQAHWNVKGMNFYSLHLLFDQLALSIEPYIDTLAERITTLGGVAQGTLRMAAKDSRLPEFPTQPQTGEAYLKALIERVATYAASNRKASLSAAELAEPSTEDLLIEISRVVDKQLYFLESHLPINV